MDRKQDPAVGGKPVVELDRGRPSLSQGYVVYPSHPHVKEEKPDTWAVLVALGAIMLGLAYGAGYMHDDALAWWLLADAIGFFALAGFRAFRMDSVDKGVDMGINRPD